MKKKHWFPFLMVWGIHHFGFGQQQELLFSASDVKEDFEYLYKSLQDSHFNLYAHVSKIKYDSAYNSMIGSIGKDSLTLLEAVKLFQRFTALGNVGHSEIDFPVQSYISFAANGGLVFPIELAFENGRAYIRKDFTNNPEIKKGAQLTSIDDIPINDIQSKIHPYLSAERVYFKNAKLEFWSFPRMFWLVHGSKAEFSIRIKNPDGKVKRLKVDAIPVMDFESERGGEILNSRRFLTYFDKAAYLNPGPFSSPDGIEGETKFRQFIDSAFTDINSKGVKNLIIDLRNNSGGHNSYSDYLISFFADKPFRWYSKFQLKTSSVLKEQTLKSSSESENNDYTRTILNHEDGEIFNYELPIQKEAGEDSRFTGNVYVLINRQTYSMAAVSAALIQDYKFAKIIGEETADVPTLYASQFSFPLPATGIAVKVPKGYIVRPNGSLALSGVVPDIMVKDHLLDDKDEILEYLLEHLNKLNQKK